MSSSGQERTTVERESRRLTHKEDFTMDDENKVNESTEPADISRVEELLNKERYTPAEAAEVLNMRQRLILSAVYGGELHATMAGRDIVSISRSDLVAWLRRREQ
jgi:excisionase family DNA binding protein